MVFVLKGGKYLLRYLYRKQLSEKYEIYRRTKKSLKANNMNLVLLNYILYIQTSKYCKIVKEMKTFIKNKRQHKQV